MDRYQHSVFEVCSLLTESMNGTAHCLSLDCFLHYTAWLCWRIEDGWTAGVPKMGEVDDAIRHMARMVARKAAIEAIRKADQTRT